MDWEWGNDRNGFSKKNWPSPSPTLNFFLMLLLWKFGKISGWKHSLWNSFGKTHSKFAQHLSPNPKEWVNIYGRWWRWLYAIAKASIFQTVDTQHVFYIMSGPQQIKAARSPFSKPEGCFILHWAGPGFLTAVQWGRRILLLKKCNKRLRPLPFLHSRWKLTLIEFVVCKFL